jgi:hypothetical protein
LIDLRGVFRLDYPSAVPNSEGIEIIELDSGILSARNRTKICALHNIAAITLHCLPFQHT